MIVLTLKFTLRPTTFNRSTNQKRSDENIYEDGKKKKFTIM